MKQLEARLGGVRLLDRDSRAVALTDTGRAFLVEARRTLAQAEHAQEIARRAGRGQFGSLRIGFSPSAPNGLFPHVVRAFRVRHPDVALDLHEMWSAQQSEALVSDRLDVGFAQVPTVDSELLCAEVIEEEPVMLVVADDHPLARRRSVTLTAIAGESVILFPRHRSPRYFDEIVSMCRRAGFSPDIVQEVTEIDATLGLVAAGLGLTLLPRSSRTLRRRGVRYVELRGTVPRARTAVVWREDDLSPPVLAFVQVARELGATRPAR